MIFCNGDNFARSGTAFCVREFLAHSALANRFAGASLARMDSELLYRIAVIVVGSAPVALLAVTLFR
jgi:hypothetical protein